MYQRRRDLVLERAGQDRHRGSVQARWHHLRLGEGSRGLHLGAASPGRSSRRPTSSWPRARPTGRAARATSASRSRRLTTGSKRPSSASRTPSRGGTSPRGTAPHTPKPKRTDRIAASARSSSASTAATTDWPLEESLAELERLADTAGAEVVATATQRLDRPHPRTFIGTGKAEEIAELVKELDATLVIFDDDLTPSQQANLENAHSRDARSPTAPRSSSTSSRCTPPAERASSRSSSRRWSTCSRGCEACGGTWTSTPAAES